MLENDHRVRLALAELAIVLEVFDFGKHLGRVGILYANPAVSFPASLGRIMLELDGEALGLELLEEGGEAARVVVPPASVHIRSVLESEDFSRVSPFQRLKELVVGVVGCVVAGHVCRFYGALLVLCVVRREAGEGFRKSIRELCEND